MHFSELIQMLAEGGRDKSVGTAEFAKTFLQKIKDLYGAESASIWKVNSRSRLELVTTTEEASSVALKTVELTTESDTMVLAFLEKRPCSTFLPDYYAPRRDKLLTNATASVSVPIVIRDHCVYGVLNVGNPGHPYLRQLEDDLGIAANLYAKLMNEGRYPAQSHLSLAAKFDFIKFAPGSPMADTVEKCKMYAQYNTRVMILGETGTGKELLAKVIHNSSKRKDGPLICYNCAYMKNHLAESILFGHKKGTFTGADEDRPGIFEAAEKGTLFLDEIADLDLGCQTMLLRTLAENEGCRMGETTVRPYDVRVVTATSRDLSQMIIEGKFRDDLWFRLAQSVVRVPPMQGRSNDLLVLTKYFLEEFAGKYELIAPTLSAEAEEYLIQYPWPGNARQVENVARGAVIEYHDNEISGSEIGGLIGNSDWNSAGRQVSAPTGTSNAPPAIANEDPLKRRIIDAATNKKNQYPKGKPKKTKVAEALGMTTNTLRNRIEKFGLNDLFE